MVGTEEGSGAGTMIDLVALGPTPLAMLLAVVALAAAGAAAVAGAGLAGGRWVDRRWPADEPLSPTEVLWGEYGGYVEQLAPGTDVELLKDLAHYFESRTVAAGEPIVEAGDPAGHYLVVRKGGAAAGDRELKPGDAIGADEILRGVPHAETVVATGPTELLSLRASEYLAATAFGVEGGDAEYVMHRATDYLASGTAAPAAPPAPPPPDPVLPVAERPPLASADPPSPPPPPAAPSPRTHRVAAGGADAFALPRGTKVDRHLDAGTGLTEIGRVGSWVHVEAGEWQGWVLDANLEGGSE